MMGRNNSNPEQIHRANYRTSILLLMIFSCALLAGCTPATTVPDYAPHDSSLNSLDWAGVYRGYLPCADCAGIETTLTLNQDLTYQLLTRYDSGETNQFEQNGRFTWDAGGNMIVLEGIRMAPNRYQVGENRLFQLDMQGKRISGALADRYVLNKLNQNVTSPPPASLFGVRWQLVGMVGKELSVPPERSPSIQFMPETSSVSGFAGCNQYSGTYELLPGNRLRFSQMSSTLMACADMSMESEFHQLLTTIDNYTIRDGTLFLNRAKMAPLLEFMALPPAKP